MQVYSVSHNKFGTFLNCVIACAVISFHTFSSCSSLRADESAKPYEKFDESAFNNNSASITNRWMPLSAGSRFVYAGSTLDEDGRPAPHRVVIHVTDLIKVIKGIRTRVTWDLDYRRGELVEAELAFYAQDKNGNVWRMGEYPVEYEGGQLADNPAWIASIRGAKAGISMHHNPRINTPSYSQGWAPDVNFTDRGRVYQKGLEVCVPLRCFKDVLVIVETSDDEPDARQFKYFAPGFGNIKVGWGGEDDKNQELLELVDYIKLTGENLNSINEQAILLEESAYKLNRGVYGATKPMVKVETSGAQ